MDTNVRLLVHAGASSTRQDDDKRVAQAAAYLDLEPTSNVHSIWPESRIGNEDAGTRHARDQRTSNPLQDSSTFIDSTQLAYTSLESQLLPSSARTLRPTPAKRRSYDLPVSSTAPVSSKLIRLAESPLSSRVSQSQPIEEENGRKRVCLESDRPVLLTEEAGPAQNRSAKPKPKEKTQSTEGTLTTNDTTSELPTSYSLGTISDSPNKRPQLSNRSISDPGPIAPGQDASHEVLLQVQSQDKITQGEQRPFGNTSITPRTNPRAPSVNVAPRDDVRAQEASPGIFPPSHSLSTSIQPAGPTVSVEPFTTHITSTLRQLIQNPDLSATFTPKTIARDLDIWERGHWEIQCSDWAPELQTSFWKFLETMVGGGKAGWGVWCTRGPEIALGSQSSQRPDDITREPIDGAFGPVRVYCWGEVVKHVYLLLFVASNSKVRRLSLRWIDAKGLVAVQM